MTNVQIHIKPRFSGWENLQLESFFDENTIILEGHELEFSGSGQIRDPETKAIEKIEFHAPMSTCQIILSLGEEYATNGNSYPRINID